MMKITSVQMYEYRVDYAHGTYVMSHGRTATGHPAFVVRLGTDAGIDGWAETCPNGATYSPSFFAGERAALQLLAEVVIGQDPRNLAHINAAMDAAMMGAPAAKSALDIACWDILGKSADLPVATLLGGVMQESIRLATSLPLEAPDTMAAYASAQRDAGVTNFQVKVGDDWKTDVARVEAVMDAVGPDTSVVVDANGGWTLQSALLAVGRLGHLPIHLEQPCRTLADCAEVRRHTSLPMIADESINTLADLALAKSLGIGGVNIKPQRVGGLTRARLLRDAAQALGMNIEVDDTWGGSLVTAHVAQLAASTDPRNFLVAAFFSDWTVPAVSEVPVVTHGGGLAEALSGPGLGVEVDVSTLGAPTYELAAGRARVAAGTP
jgi:L-alanine-DL-glutamate epimerase-like enolase superfamily enzyme